MSAAASGVPENGLHLPKTPTQARAGTEEKILIMMERAERGEYVFHPDDGYCPETEGRDDRPWWDVD